MKGQQQQDYSKFQYLCCRVKEHEDQFLNLVCIHKQCKNNGLICSLCRQQHKNHRVIPLKHLVANLKNNLNSPPDENIYCAKLQQLQNLKQAMLYSVKSCVQNLAEQFRAFEQDILNSYTKIKNEIIEQIELGMQFEDLMAYAMTINSVLKQEQYIEIYRKIAKRINYTEKQINFAYDFTDIIVPLKQKEKKMLFNLKDIEDNVEKKFKIITQQVKVLKQKQKDISSPQVATDKIKYRFSRTYLPKNIKLNEQRTQARQTQSANSRFVLIQQGMGLKNKKIVFKVTQLKNWVGLGVCIRDKIASVDYAFKYETLGHGSYLLSSNGYTWSHNRKEDNINPCGYKFLQDNKVEVTLTETQLIFVVIDKQQKSKVPHKLSIMFKQTEWPQVCFCINLCSPDDTVQILDE